MSKEIAEEYASSLSDLTVNSKPLINMLTILAEENVDHAAVIVDTVEKHLEKVSPEIKLPVLYLVDSIIKNVGGAYTQKFSQSIVNMFTRTFRQVDEKTRSQMFKLRETWHDVFPPTKLYQLDVKVNLIDPAWPIQAQPQQNIHVNPNFLKKPVATASIPVPVQTKEEDEKIRSIVAKKEQELLMLQRKKIEIELEQTKKQLEMAEKNAKQKATSVPVVPPRLPPTMPAALVNPVVTPSLLQQSAVVPSVADVTGVPAKQRLGPPVNSSKAVVGRIAPVSNAMLAATRRDPRLARHQPAGHAPPAPPATIAPNVFDIKPLERVTKRKNVITIDVQTDAVPVRERTRDPRRRDPRLDKSRRDADERNRKPDREKRLAKKEEEKRKREDKHKSDLGRNDKSDGSNTDINAAKPPKSSVDDFIDRFIDAKKITKLPPIPKLNRQAESPKKNSDTAPSPTKRRKDLRDKKAKKDDKRDSSKESSESSPEKKTKARRKKEVKEQPMEVDAEKEDPVQFKELKNYHKERYMRRNKEKSESPEVVPKEAKESAEAQTSNPPEVSENKDVDLRVLPAVAEVPAPLALKRLSTETLDGKAKKSKVDKFDILFGNEDVDLRQLPQVEEAPVPPPPPNITGPASPQPDEKPDEKENGLDGNAVPSPHVSPKTKDWNEEKDKRATSEEPKKMPTELELVRAKLAKATEGKDRLGRPLLFSKSLSVEKERRRTISSSEDIDLRAENRDDEVSEETINMILSQAKQYFKDGKMDKNSYNTLMFQLMQINEGLKLKEAKQRESLEVSKRRLHRTQVTDEEHYVPSPKSSPTNHNRFGDIDERIPPPFIDTPPNSQDVAGKDSDMRIAAMRPYDPMDGPIMPPGCAQAVPRPPMMPPMFMGPGLGPVPPNFRPMWRGARPGVDEYVPRRGGRGNAFFRGKFERLPRPHFLEPRLLPLPLPKLGMFQGECPLKPYVRSRSPPPLGAAGESIPPTDPAVLEYIDQDPMKTIDIDGVPREIRFYGETAVIMLDWDDPREIRFLPASRRVTFDNKDSIVLSFNDGYKQVEIDDQVFDIRFGAPTRELFVNGRWYECFFGAPPCGILIDGKPRIIQLEGPPPQVDIRKEKRTDLVAGKINLIVDAKHMCPLFLDGKVQRFKVESEFFTIRFVDSLKTVLINEKPFQVEFGGLPKPINIGKNKHFIRFSVLPKNVRPGQIKIASMEGKQPEDVVPVPEPEVPQNDVQKMETDEAMPRPVSSPSPDGENSNQGNLDMLASVMPSSMAPASSSSGYSLAEPLFSKTDKIPGLEPQTPKTEEPQPPPVTIPMLGNINVNDLFAKLVASGIVQTSEKKEQEDSKKPVKPKEDKTVVHVVDLLRPETLRVKQPALVAKIYGGMQCSGCGARFPPEHTVRYSQHLDWHFRQNRRERDSARRAHSRHWHYDLSDWVQYEEVEDLEEREKSWFETGGAEGEAPEGAPEAAEEAPSVAAGAPLEHRCALCGDKFDQFYNEDKEEWHLRKALKHEDLNYHPLCFEDYKASLAAKEPPLEETIEEIKDIPSPKKLEEPIEIDETIEDINSQSDDESVVEVVETASQKEEAQEPLEIDEGDEDDVVLKAEPVEEVCVDDDNDTDDETTATRAERDKQAEIDFSRVRIKQEPVDPDDEPIITAEEEATKTNADTTSNTVLSSIDGNVQLEATGQGPVLPGGGIRINITKTIPAFISTPADNQFSMLEDVSADDEPLPPGEEPELEYKLKPTLEDIRLSRQPPVQKGSELSGLCSIM